MQKFPSKTLTPKVFSHRGPSQGLFKIHFKLSYPIRTNTPPRTTYIIQGDLLYIRTQFTLILPYKYAHHHTSLWSYWMQALGSSFNLTQGDLLYIA